MNSSHNLWLSWWSAADWVLRAVFIILIGLSVLSWTVIIYKWRQISAAQRIERERSRHIAPTADINELAKRLSGDELSQALQQELKDLVAARAGEGIDRETVEAKVGLWMRGRRVELESYLPILATIGNSSPFIGLFGTVWGIMHALQAHGGSQMLSLQMIAGPGSEALVATAAGLFAAIPAVMAYYFFVRNLRTVTLLVDMSGNALVEAMLSHHPRRHGEHSSLSVVCGFVCGVFSWCWAPDNAFFFFF